MVVVVFCSRLHRLDPGYVRLQKRRSTDELPAPVGWQLRLVSEQRGNNTSNGHSRIRIHGRGVQCGLFRIVGILA